jgi:hypothetical protein
MTPSEAPDHRMLLYCSGFCLGQSVDQMMLV